MPVELIAELATAHGGDVDLACDMVAPAAEAGAHTVKIQSYTLARLNPNDPQAAWLTKAYLDEAAHVRIMQACAHHNVQFLSTPFDAEALGMLRHLGVERFKIASTQSDETWWSGSGLAIIASRPWGRGRICGVTNLTAIPLYPTPLECVGLVPVLEGWSDHCVGIQACQYAMARGARVVEAHLWIQRSRHMPWDKSPAEFAELRRFADAVETMTTGVATHFRERWTA